MDQFNDQFPGRVILATFSDGTHHVVDPSRADPDVAVGHPNAWAANMLHALVDVDGADIRRGPRWSVERLIRLRGLTTASGGTDEASVLACVPPYADGMLRGLRFDMNLPITATFTHEVDGRVFHAVYRVVAPHRGAKRVEVYGVLLAAVPATDPYETWLPATSLTESWRLDAPAVADVYAALLAPSLS